MVSIQILLIGLSEQVRNQSAGQNTSGSSGRGRLPESELPGPMDGESSVPFDGLVSTLGRGGKIIDSSMDRDSC